MRTARQRLHALFEASIVLKGLFATAEVLSGLGIWLVKADWVMRIAHAVTQAELSEDPTDFLAAWALNLARGFSVETQHFWSLYLFGHGVLKLAVVAALMAGIGWAYPASVVVLAGFVAWQMTQFFTTGGMATLLLSVFDLVVIWLILQEYKTLRLMRRE
ncbi:DUF2127 domain-containing protein [Phaeovulum sp.]|uniref:DUF2127 domain-containing protein n=1 Tax=Phaeovulum sp. TaxID=2934796 RepID=UPI003566C102